MNITEYAERIKNPMLDLETTRQDHNGTFFSVSPSLCVLENNSGFTLLEMVVVITIIGMVLMLVIPRLPSSESENLKVSARTLASTVRYMQDRAATSRTTYYLHLEAGTDNVRIQEAGGDGNEKDPEDPLLQKRPVKEGIIVADVYIPRLGKVNEGQVRLNIGMAGLRDFVVIHLRAPDNNFWTVMAFPTSGKVKVYQGYQEDAL